MRPSSLQKREAALRAAERQFLATGYESVTMDSIAAECGIAKQTLYSHFGSKRALFLELVTAETVGTRRAVLSPPPRIDPHDEPRAALRELLVGQLQAVLTPKIVGLRRLVIGELTRSPELAEALYEHGPKRAITTLAGIIGELQSAGVLRTADPERAAAQLNWMVMGEPLNRAMMLGDASLPDRPEIEAQVDAALELFFDGLGTGPR